MGKGPFPLAAVLTFEIGCSTYFRLAQFMFPFSWNFLSLNNTGHRAWCLLFSYINMTYSHKPSPRVKTVRKEDTIVR